MSRYEQLLNHHEEIRLEYLRKNIHYLNEREQRELDYLEAKAAGLIERPRSSRSRSTSQKNYQSSYRASYEEEDYDDLYYEEEVPEYPRQQRQRRRRAVAEATKKTPKASKQSLVRPKKKRKKGKLKRFLTWIVVLLLLTLGGMVFMFFKGLHGAKTESQAKAAQTEVFNGVDTKDGVNILILGTDGRAGEASDVTRTDSIMVLNINNKDNKIKLVSFMRDTLIDIDGYDYKLNVAYTLGEQDNNQGAEGVRLALKENFDIDIKYYALVDFSTFVTAIDTLFPNGVKIDAQFSTIDGETVSSVEVPDDLNATAEAIPNQTIAVGEQQMDGRTLLNYSRFRKDDEGDYGRTRRQQQVMSAIMSQIKDPTKLFTGAEALGKVFSLTSTNIPYSFILTNGVGAATAGSKGVEHITVPEFGDWVDDYDIYDGLGLRIDFDAYKQRLSDLGLR